MKKTFLSGLGLVAVLCATEAVAFEPFTVKDIRVDGIQRTEAGTVFSYLPIKVGDTMTDEKAAQAIKALFATGFFKDVRIEVDGWRARILQHEFDHLDGVLYLDRLGDRDWRTAQKISRKQGWGTPGKSWMPGVDDLDA